MRSKRRASARVAVSGLGHRISERAAGGGAHQGVAIPTSLATAASWHDDGRDYLRLAEGFPALALMGQGDLAQDFEPFAVALESALDPIVTDFRLQLVSVCSAWAVAPAATTAEELDMIRRTPGDCRP